MEDRRLDYDKYKVLQSQSGQQQSLLQQLQTKLSQHESDQENELKEKANTIDDLHNRLKSNIDAVNHLNNQLSMMQKENIKLRSDLEKSLTNQQTLRLQLEKYGGAAVTDTSNVNIKI